MKYNNIIRIILISVDLSINLSQSDHLSLSLTLSLSLSLSLSLAIYLSIYPAKNVDFISRLWSPFYYKFNKCFQFEQSFFFFKKQQININKENIFPIHCNVILSKIIPSWLLVTHEKPFSVLQVSLSKFFSWTTIKLSRIFAKPSDWQQNRFNSVIYRPIFWINHYRYYLFTI